jgi:hypothetical protein
MISECTHSQNIGKWRSKISSSLSYAIVIVLFD